MFFYNKPMLYWRTSCSLMFSARTSQCCSEYLNCNGPFSLTFFLQQINSDLASCHQPMQQVSNVKLRSWLPDIFLYNMSFIHCRGSGFLAFPSITSQCSTLRNLTLWNIDGTCWSTFNKTGRGWIKGCWESNKGFLNSSVKARQVEYNKGMFSPGSKSLILLGLQ